MTEPPDPPTPHDQDHERSPTHGRRIGKRVGRAVGGAVGGAVDLAVGTVETIGKSLGTGLETVSGLSLMPRHRHKAGAAPGIESDPGVNTPPPPGAVRLRCVDYGPDRIETCRDDEQALDTLFDRPRPDWATVRWINVDGLHPYVVNRFRERFGIHTLAAEDILHVPQRPKAERFEDHTIVIARMMRIGEGRLVAEQVSLLVREGLLVTFQEAEGDVWDPIRQRLEDAGSKLRQRDVSFLAYALLDAIVDHCFPLLEHYGDVLEQLEDQIVNLDPDDRRLRRVFGIKQELSHLRRVMWPTRELVDALSEREVYGLSADARTYLRDVHEHTVQVVEILEAYRDNAASLADLHFNAVSTRMNEIMKVLTIMATLFIPITFLAGIYGMNFEYIPELDVRWAYPAFWGVCLTVTVGLLGYFVRKGWIGRRHRE